MGHAIALFALIVVMLLFEMSLEEITSCGGKLIIQKLEYTLIISIWYVFAFVGCNSVLIVYNEPVLLHLRDMFDDMVVVVVQRLKTSRRMQHPAATVGWG